MNLENQILINMLNELNICKAKHSIHLKSGLVPSILTERIAYLEREIERRKNAIIPTDK